MIALTVRPPWSQIIAETAALTALGVEPKLIENRGRAISDRHVGQDIAIHAGKTWCKAGEADPRVRKAWSAFYRAIDLREVNPKLAAIGDRRTGFVGGLRVPSLWIDEGAVVAVARLVDCHDAEQPRVQDATCCWPWGERYHRGPTRTVPAWHLVLADVRRLDEPVPAKGSLAVPWTLPPEVAAVVEQQLAGVTV